MITLTCPPIWLGQQEAINIFSQTILCNSKWGKRSFKYSAVFDWLQISHNISYSVNIKKLKKRLMSHLLKTQEIEMLQNNPETSHNYSCIEDLVNQH